ncbi:hypothetical protein CC78DRAFT_548194 [Lojkania enalia]|uniref:Uncharacterized protein n=1 Tax=Lojkania enalia TaxID=147567 RepID=A0A9P4K016_9PLEO|nr:hypothetical protein CC78DRAFT_548194 [Didymosphaeria enalia]
MSENYRKEQNRTRAPVQHSAPAAGSSSAVCTPLGSNTGTQTQTAIRQPSLHHLTSSTSVPDDYHKQSSQPAVADYNRDQNQLDGFSTLRFDLQQPDAREGSIRTSLPPQPPKLTPMEPRAIYPSL